MAPADLALLALKGGDLFLALAQLQLIKRRFSMVMTLARFWCWDRSCCDATTMPVGIWVIRTALSVLLICWPPAPDAR